MKKATKGSSATRKDRHPTDTALESVLANKFRGSKGKRTVQNGNKNIAEYMQFVFLNSQVIGRIYGDSKLFAAEVIDSDGKPKGLFLKCKSSPENKTIYNFQSAQLAAKALSKWRRDHDD